MSGNPRYARLRIATWNIHRCIGTDGVLSPERCSAVLGEIDADIVALQEVDFDPDDPGYSLAALSREHHYVGIPGVTMLRKDTHYGNAIMTRVSPDAIRRHDLSVAGREPRGAIDIDLTHNGHRIRFVATHLGLRPAERRAQVLQLLGLMRDEGHDLVIVAGDFNEWFLWGRLLRLLHRKFPRTPHLRTWPSRLPVFALDRIWSHPGVALRALQTYRSEATRVASDHLPLVADISCSPESGQNDQR